VTTIHYLQWHRTDPEPNRRATDLFHEFHYDPPEQLAERDFEDLYAEVADVETADLNQLWREWNRGSGYESDAFLEREVRSLSVGDIVEQDEGYQAVAPIGWQSIEVVEDDAYA
jgi:hypothetical protein